MYQVLIASVSRPIISFRQSWVQDHRKVSFLIIQLLLMTLALSLQHLGEHDLCL